MDELMRYLPLIVPILFVQIILMIVALLDLRKQEQTRGPKWVWILVIIFINLIGPILYLVLGRQEE